MTRHLLLSLFVLSGIGIFWAARPTAAQTCAVSANYLEAIDEHRGTLLRLNVASNTGGQELNYEATAESNYRLLMSMRDYHERQRGALPACAQAANTATLDAISSSQEVLGVLFLLQLNPERIDPLTATLTGRVDALRLDFATLDAALSTAGLVALD